MKVTIQDSDGGVSHLYFGEDAEIFIGSDSGCGVHIQDLRLPGQNARLIPGENEQWTIEHLSPTHHVYVNRRLLTEPTPVKKGDEIVLQEYVLRLYPGAVLDEVSRDDSFSKVNTEDLAKIKQYPLPPGASVRRRFDMLNVGPHQLDAASLAGLAIADSRDTHAMIDSSLDVLLKTFQARAAWLGVRRQPSGDLDVVGGRLKDGQPCANNPILEMMRYRCVDRTQYVHARKTPKHDVIGTAIGAPLVMGKKTYGMVYVDREKRAEQFQAHDLDLLSLIASQIAAKHEALLEERHHRETSLANIEIDLVHELQAMLDPKSLPMWENYTFAAYSRSGQERPGDIYDVMKHPDLEITAFLIAHVNATGAPLALAMSRLQATFRVGFLHKDRMHALARTQNWLMVSEKDPSTIDAIFLMFDPKSGKVEYIRCGKMGAVIVDAKGQPRGLPGDTNPPIGKTPNYEYTSSIEQLNPGDTLGLYTRGVATCTNDEGKKFSELRFLETVCDGFGESPAAIINDLSNDLSSFFTDGKHPDDISIMLLQRES